LQSADINKVSGRPAKLQRGRALVLLILAGAMLVGLCAFAFYYVRFGHLIDQRLSGQIFQNTSRVYSRPERIFLGEALRAGELESHLVRAGYTPKETDGATGWFSAAGGAVEVHPSETSYFEGGNALRVNFAGGAISRITLLEDGQAVDSAETEPEILTNLFDSSREKRRVVKFDDLPKTLVEAVLSVEDKRFFEHGGFDLLRILGAALADLRHAGAVQGASTIDMQVARSFFFTTKREWRRKLEETMVALELQQRFSKDQIFELYANEIYLGNRGSFAIRGFGEGAEAYFGKDVRELNLAQSAFLAGIIHSPNRYSAPERHPARAAEGRDRGLDSMVENGVISRQQEDSAKIMPLNFVGATETGAAPYFVDMVKDHLLERLSEAELSNESYRIYTTLDPQLQHAAVEALNSGMKDVDAKLARRYEAWKKKGQPVPQVQAGMVVLDPATGEILALVGGRNYGESQLNHALARRQPGSSFKPFVYAAALNSGVDGAQPLITPVTTVVDEPTTFEFDGKEYSPDNYGEKFYGTVTLREALTHSLNVATVKVAEMVGYGHLVQLARQMGLDPGIRATPAMALGAYEMTPLDVAAGYTIFANDGVRAEPYYVQRVVSGQGSTLESNGPKRRNALDPRVAFLTTSLMTDVLNRGTGGVVRKLGFTAPAAGKTGTSRDGWFAGFTSNLLCVVWVGFDDNRDLGLAGGATAAPIWADFMKKAVALPAYRNAKPFGAPEGVTGVVLDPQSVEVATPYCPTTFEEVFIMGTEPRQFCQLHGGGEMAAAPPGQPIVPGTAVAAGGTPVLASAVGAAVVAADPQAEAAKNKKGFFKRIFGIFGGSKSPPESSMQAPQATPAPQPKPPE
jgi:penicillin-binding protein 1B